MPSLDSANVNPEGLSNIVRRQYTCIPDYTDIHLLGAASPTTPGRDIAADLPLEVCLDTSKWVVHNQETEKSCVGYATSTLREHYTHAAGREAVQLSPLFIYWWARKLDNMQMADGGSRIMHAMTCLTLHGVCEESYHKNVPGTNADVFFEPSTAAMVAAAAYRITASYPVRTVRQLKAALADGHPVVMGIPVHESMESAKVDATGVVPVPRRGEKVLGGHAVVACGYSDRTQRVKFHNSWGVSWGDRGCGYVPYELLVDGQFNAWEIRA